MTGCIICIIAGALIGLVAIPVIDGICELKRYHGDQ